MKKRKETQKDEQFSSSPMLTRQVMEVNKYIERFQPLRAFGKIWSLFSDLPEEVRERAKPRIDLSRAEKDGVDEKYIEEVRAKEENQKAGLFGRGRRKDGKQDFNIIYSLLCTSEFNPMNHTAYIEDIQDVREVWMRLRDVIKDAGLLDDRTRTILSGEE